MDVTEQISKTAVEMIKNENLPEDIKNTAKKTIIDEYKVAKKQLMDQIVGDQDAILNSDTDKLAKRVEEVEKNQEMQAPKLMTMEEIASNNNRVDLSRTDLLDNQNVTPTQNENSNSNNLSTDQVDYNQRDRVGMDYEDDEVISGNTTNNNTSNQYNQNYNSNTQNANLFDDRLSSDDDDDELI